MPFLHEIRLVSKLCWQKKILQHLVAQYQLGIKWHGHLSHALTHPCSGKKGTGFSMLSPVDNYYLEQPQTLAELH